VKKILCLTLLLSLLSVGCTNYQKIDYDKYLKLENEINHNNKYYTEGLEYNNDALYETSGLDNESFIAKNNNKVKGIPNYFLEGFTFFKDKLYILTFQNNKILVLNKDTLAIEKEEDYDREGWGLTNDGYHLIASDGTDKIYFMNEKLETIRTINVTINHKPVNYLNELEYINDKIWANVWQRNIIYVIDPKTGYVEKEINFNNLIQKYKVNKVKQTMNGIAFNKDKVYITGKYWDKVFEFSLKEKNVK
jgi:glutamine cyclotransferase